jgi:hypothetical protein
MGGYRLVSGTDEVFMDGDSVESESIAKRRGLKCNTASWLCWFVDQSQDMLTLKLN